MVFTLERYSNGNTTAGYYDLYKFPAGKERVGENYFLNQVLLTVLKTG